MKKILNVLIVVIWVSSAHADDDYSDMVYTATSFMYWCKYKEIPKSKNDFAKVTDVNDPNPKLTLTPDEWFKTVKFKVEGEKLKVIRTSKVIKNGSNTSKSTSTSTSNCESHEVIRKQLNKANQH